MLGSGAGGKKPIKEAEELHARKAKLERVSSELTKHKNADEKLYKAQADWEKTFDAISDWVAITDLKGRILRTNRSGEDFTAISSAQIVGQSCCKLVHGSEEHIPGCPLQKMLHTRQRESAELKEPDTNRWLIVTVDPIVDKEGNLVGAVHITRDITERKKAENKKDELLRTIETAKESMCIISPSLIITYTNDAMDELFGYKKDELIGKHVSTCNTGATPEAVAREIGNSIEREGWWEGEVHNIRKDGTEFISYATTSAYRDKDGKIISFLSTQHDITQHKKAEQRLKESEERFRKIVDTAPGYLLITDQHGKNLYVSPHCEKITGYSQNELIGQIIWWVHEDDTSRAKEVFQSAYRDGRPGRNFEYKAVKKNGQVWHASTSWETIKDSKGQLKSVVVQTFDITERKRAEEAYRSLVDHSLQGLSILQDGHVVFANQALAEITGYTIDELLAMSPEQMQAFVHPDDRELVWSRHRDRLNGEELPERYEFRGIRKDGSTCWLELHANRIEYNGKPAIQAAYVDITERKRAGQALSESEEKFKGIFEHANDGIIYLDSSGKILDINEKAAQMFGGPKEEALNKHFTNLSVFSPDQITTLMSNFEKIFTGKEVVLTVPIKNKKGQEMILECSASLTKTDDGDGRIMVIARDITERKKAEEQIEKLAKFPAEDPYPVLRISGYGMVIYANTASLPLLKVWRCRVGQSLPDPWHELVMDALSSGHSQQTEVQCDSRIFSLTFAPIVEANYVNVYGLDITERKRAEEGLRSSRDYLKKLTDSMWDAVFSVKMPERVIEWANDSFRLIGYEPEECIGKTTEFLYPDDSEFLDFGNKLKGAIAVEKDVLHAEQILRRKNGDTFPAEITTTFFREKGEIVRVTSIVRDVSERKKAEERLLEHQAKLKAMASKILMTEERERQRLAVGLHDSVCQKLVLTKLALESSLNLVSDSKVLASLRIACGGIGETIEQADSLTFELSNPVLRQLGFVIALEKYLTEEIQQKYGIAYELQSDEQFGTMQDEIKNCLFRVTRELLTNVVKHAQSRKVRVSVRESQSQIYVRVQDDGVGFKESQAGSKVSQTARFGLFSIREQLEYLGGHLEIESEPGRGTTATAVVPLRKQLSKREGGKK